MKVRSVIIDSLNSEFMDAENEEQTEFPEKFFTKFSTFIDKVLQSQRNPIVVINNKGDDLLRKIPKLFDCDLVYTQNSSHKYEGLLSGLHGAGTCALYLPLHAEYGDEDTWRELEKSLIQLPYLNNTHILIPNGDGPWLITPAGMLYLKSKDEGYELDKDKDLNKLHISS